MILSPAFSYGSQIREMVKTQKAEGFSTFCSFVVIFSSVIRVFWYYQEPFNLVIYYCTLVNAITHIVLLYYWSDIMAKQKSKCDEKFWYWFSIEPYLQLVFITCVVLHVLCARFDGNPTFIWALGAASSLIDAQLAVP